jgi:hypothetical protein
VIPFDGSAPVAPLAGVMVTAGPVGVGLGVADAGFAPAVPVADAAPVLPAWLADVVPLPVQAVTARTSALAAANADTARIPLMSTPFPSIATWNTDIRN